MAPGLDQLEVIPFKVAAYNKKNKKMEFFDPEHKVGLGWGKGWAGVRIGVGLGQELGWGKG